MEEELIAGSDIQYQKHNSTNACMSVYWLKHKRTHTLRYYLVVRTI